MASLILLIATRHETLCLSLTFSYLVMFYKIYRYPKHRKTLSWGKLIIINFTLSDIDKTKPSVLFYMINLFSIFGGLSVVFSPGNQPLNITKNWLSGKLFGRLGRPDNR